MISVSNSNKNPNVLHTFLLNNGIKIRSLRHNREYDENGVLILEATDIFVELYDEKQTDVIRLIDEFMQA